MNESTLIKWPYIFCCLYKTASCTFGIYFFVLVYVSVNYKLMHISVHTYAQCAAVRTHRLLIREPPQKDPPLIMRATCHGNWPRDARLPLVIRLACSLRDTWTFPEKTANTHKHISMQQQKQYVRTNINTLFTRVIHAIAYFTLLIQYLKNYRYNQIYFQNLKKEFSLPLCDW